MSACHPQVSVRGPQPRVRGLAEPSVFKLNVNETLNLLIFNIRSFNHERD